MHLYISRVNDMRKKPTACGILFSLFTECDQNLPVWNIIVMAISTASFIFGVAVAVTLGILIFLRAKNSDGEVYWHRYAWMFCSV